MQVQTEAIPLYKVNPPPEYPPAARKRGFHFNAHTDHDLMTLEVSLPAEHLEFGLNFVKEKIFALKLSKDELEREKTIIIEEINQNLAQRRKEFQAKELPKDAVSSAYPPCIKRLYELLLAGQHLSHIGRFTLTSFLLKIGVEDIELTKLYTSTSDFDEKLTQYQVEHIAGKKGSRIKYNPPSCSTLKTHGLCLNPDDKCKKISHPLSYYEKKLGIFS